MGDHRASIKIQMEFHGIEDSCDMWINYCDSDGNGVDSRVTEFFENMYRRGMAKYNEELWESQEEQRERETQMKERKEYERLKAKFEGKP